jgi:HPt (histidine-containing phosphotransfer) domain-containing protein
MPESDLLDPRMLDAIRQLDDGATGLLSQVVRIYIQSAPALLAKLRRGMDDGDHELVRQAAHSLKASSANLGAARLAALCKRVESDARARALGPDTPRAHEVEAEYHRVQAALEQELKAA